ncbi:non-ribosomal peptide synthetase, partial [Actinophytocola sp.]|uniref:non-ribosomal peptide synthetase n=1 Tax=Actinophytocola sp. TaxID=1872138 RepID=UPI003D6B3ADE
MNPTAADDVFFFPTSSGQRRLWLQEQLMPRSSAFHNAWRVRLCGPLDPDRLAEALRTVVDRHDALRTTYTDVDGLPSQVVAARAGVPLVATKESDVDRLVREPFDLTTGPLLRTGLLRRSASERELLLVVHQSVADGWSCALLLDEIARLYGGERLPTPELQHPDYAVWQREQADANSYTEAAQYWRETLAGIPTVLTLPTDRRRATVRGRGAELVAQLEPVPGASFGTLLAVYQAMLHRLSGQAEFLVGTVVPGRTGPGTDQVVGFLANTLALPARIAPEATFAELAEHAEEAVEGALANQDLPFEHLVDLLAPRRTVAHAPVVQTLFQVEPPVEPTTVDGLLFIPERVDAGGSAFDLMLTVVPGEDRWLARWTYDTDILDAETVAGLAEIYAVALRAATADPSRRIAELPLTTASPPATAACPNRVLQPDLLRFGDAPAVVGPGGRLTYLALDAAANRLAHLLRRNGIGPDVPVGLCLARGIAVPVGILAAWRAGGGYLPLDPGWPVDRLAAMATDAGAPVLVTHDAAGVRPPGDWRVVDLDRPEVRAELAGLPDAPPDIPPPCPDRLAYLLYTSGATGRPKGVAVTHGNVANLLSHLDAVLDLSPADRFAAISSPSFDMSVVELLAPLLRGASVIVVPAAEVTDGSLLRNRLAMVGASVVQATPSVWRSLVLAGGVPASVRLRISGGEALPRDLADALLAGGARVLNGYGPTETTVYSAIGEVRAGPIRLGPPVAGTYLHVLDPALAPVPDGVVGELHIGGAGVARGYHGQPELTAARFHADPFTDCPDARLYATGDLVRRRRDGLEFLGRADLQVKVRGFRIELGEIEDALRAHESIRDAAVATWTVREDDVRLVAYLVPRRRIGMAELRPWLARRLPDYMQPNRYVTLNSLPVTPTGKLDRSALPEPVWGRHKTTTVAP